MKRRISSRTLVRSVILATFLSHSAAQAYEFTWIGNDFPSWGDQNNWNRFGSGSGNIVPLGQDGAYFTNNSPLFVTFDNFPWPVGSIDFDGTAYSALQDGNITLTYGIRIAPGAGFTDIFTDVSAPNTFDIPWTNSSSNPFKLSGTVTITNHNLTLNGSGPTTFSGALKDTGTGSLVLGGPGTVTLSGGLDNASLSAVVNTGSLILAKTNPGVVFAIGGNGLTQNGGTITYHGNQQIYGGSNIAINGGAFDLNGCSQSSPSITLFGSGGTITNSVPSASNLSLAAMIYSGNLSGNINLTLTSNTVTSYLSGTVNSSGSLTLGAGASLVLNGTSATFGPITINGVLTIQEPTSTGPATFNTIVAVLANTSVGNLNGSGQINTSAGSGPTVTLTFGSSNIDAAFFGQIDDNARHLNLTKVGTATQTLSGNNHYTGTTTVAAGTLRLGSATALSTGSVTINAGGTLDLNGQQDFIHPINNSLSIQGTLINSSVYQDVRLMGTVSSSGDATLSGPGGIVLRGAVTPAGRLIVNGPVAIQGASNNNSLAVTVNSGGYLSLDNISGYAVGSPTLPLIINSGGAVSVDPGSGNQISDNTPINLNGGTLLIQVNETVASINGAGTLTINGINPILTIGPDNSSSSIAATITGNGLLTKIGSGNLTLSGNNAYSGGTSVAAGTLFMNHPSALGTGPLAIHTGASARLAAGFGTAAILPALTLDGATNNWGGELDIKDNRLIIETTAGSHAAALADLKNQVAYGQSHKTGIFGTGVPAKRSVVVSDNAIAGLTVFGGQPADPNSIFLFSTYPGDANMDGKVNIVDLNILGNHWQQPTSDWSQANFNGDSITNITDLNILGNNWQAGVGASFSSALEIQDAGLLSAPEPASLALLATCSLFLAPRKPRKSSIHA